MKKRRAKSNPKRKAPPITKKPKRKCPRVQSGLTVEEFAKVVGASLAAIDLWRSKGMPAMVEKPTGRDGRPRLRIDLAQATDWLVANKLGGFGTPHNHNAPDLLTHPELISDEAGLAGALDRARAAERLSFRFLRESIAARNVLTIMARLESWGEFAKTLADLEKRHSNREQIEQQVHEITQQAVREWCEPKRAYIDTIPFAFSSRLLDLKTTVAAEAILQELVAALLKQLSEPVNMLPALIPEKHAD